MTPSTGSSTGTAGSRSRGDAVPLLVNPVSGGGRGRELAQRLGGDGRLELHEVEGGEAMTRAARELADDGHERVIVLGGDGTLHRAIQGLAGTDCALGIVPTGTGNDFARALGLDRRPEAALDRALQVPARAIDVGRAGDRYFACVAGIGLDGEVVRRSDRVPRRLRGPWVYPYAVARTVFQFRHPRVRLRFDGEQTDCEVWLAALANAPMFGGGMRIAPDAAIDDGLLDLIVVERFPRLAALAFFPRVYSGRHVSHPSVRALRVREAELVVERPIDLYADGERVASCGPQGVRIECVPGGLRVAA